MDSSFKVQPSTYRRITARIIEAIEAGAGTFVMPWHTEHARSRPRNAFTGKSYNGANVIALWAEAMLRKYPSSCWATYRQWQNMGAQVRAKERGTTVIFYSPADPAQESPDERSRFVLRSFRVFNAAQVAGWQEPLPLPEDTPVDILYEVDVFVRNTGARVCYGSYGAWYDRAGDYIAMPNRECFVGSPTRSSDESFYATLLHELVHWSGAAHRLNRTFGQKHGDSAYAAEELVAEIGAAFLCADLHVANEPRPDHAAYVASWLRILRGDSRIIFVAASLSSSATHYLHGLQ